jgi:nucleoside-diphosphate-sugar epimerase
MTASSQRKVVVAGALGVIGRAAVEHFVTRGDRVVGLSRRKPDFETTAEFVSVDLRDAAGCRAALARHADATQLVYAALHEMPQLVAGWFDPEHTTTNLGMLRNLLDAIESPALEHITLLQGTKAYGAHLGAPIRVPAKERDPRVEHANFYFSQEDWLRERQQDRDWRFTILRPQIVAGLAVGSAMNVVAAIGAYAAIQRERGLPFAHQGHPHALTELTDAGLLARAAEWAAGRPACNGESYNITNGDVTCWRELFRAVAAWLGVELDEDPEPQRLAETMPAQAGLWRAVAEREGLRISDLDALIGLSWQYADVLWASPVAPVRPALVSTIKAREHGFSACLDSEDGVIALLQRMRAERYLP